MSRSYTVKSGDTLGKISVKFYGVFGNWTKIKAANPQLTGRKTSYDGAPIIYVGDILVIPEETEKPAKSMSTTPQIISKSIKPEDAAEDEFSIFIDGKLYGGFTGYSLRLSMDGLDIFSFSAPWQEDEELAKVLQPFTYKECAVYYKRKILFLGRLLTSVPEVQPDSKTINIQGYPICGVLNDCCIPVSKYPPSYNGLTLKQIAEDVCEPFGVKVEFKDNPGEKLDKVEYSIGTKILDFIKKIAEQRKFIFTNDENGSLVFWKVPTEDTATVFREGELPFISCKFSPRDQEMYSHLTGFTKTDKKHKAEQFTYENKMLTGKGVFRPFSFVCEDVEPEELEEAVKAKAGQMFVNCCSYELKVYGCEDNAGNIYHKGMSVSVLAPSAMIYRETKFQVKEIEIKRSDSEGIQTVFKLMLPDSVGGNIPDKLPWEKD